MTPDEREHELQQLEQDIVSKACLWQACGEAEDDADALRDIVQRYRRLRDRNIAVISGAVRLP